MIDKSKTPLISSDKILDVVSDSALMLDHKFNCLYINEGAVDVIDFGKKKAVQIKDRNLLRLKPKFGDSLLYKKCIEAKWQNAPIVFDDYIKHLKRWYKFRIYPAEDVYLVLMRDNTEEVEIFNHIKESEEYHRTLIENVKDYAILVLDLKGKIKTWNKGAEKLLGYTAEEVLGKSPLIFYSKDGKKIGAESKQLQKVKLEGRFEHEGWWVKKDGSQFWANEILSNFRDEEGNLKGYTKVVRDMTERKNTEEMLKRYTRDLERSTRAIETEVAKDEALLDSIGEGVIATDDTGRIVVFNKQAQSLLGWSQEDAIGELYYNVWKIENENREVISNTVRPVAMALKSGKKILDSSCYYSSAYRKPFPVSMTTAPVVLEGETIGAVMVFRDISREKEVDRAKSEFVSLASHQLRTPLTAIKLFVEMLALGGKSNLTKEQNDMLQSINESNEKMIRLVENLLNVSKLETGVLAVKFEQINLKGFVNEIVNELNPVAQAKKCNLVLSMQNVDSAKVVTDPVLLRQVFNNLINNAIAYSPDKRSSVYIDVVVTPGKQYQVTVEDQGIGIPKEALPNVFQRFYRADNAVKARTEGNGLGLYMSKMITETLGGKISCTSKLNVGTTFVLTFPLGKPKHPMIKHTTKF